ncbi:uncharacterized protein LOC130826185 isoform X2 [Amaranthus tricolor]|uniref:uncharacterized protein LOC130825288 isoform X2 n=1 Tax=Amaranthus tricolor TaxID=29722 RepID=UPI0025829ADF|nr:uncharacterized protein LOC130825288 isoform X2 [Amaranthus tricolor]XP_057546423.1 uncharacterized protein LOC130825290 isoform X2 [Amaranthus tricolor]XP_057546668.1 uncharacterized protein LOC130825446 isoform X2 [Amaranthus tricolor]XP_057547740.1 uncharacterized protein LOC130826185 isoform X2 [Amaranthus tricolor]
MNTKMKKFNNGKKERLPDILDFVFLWSIKDVLNNNLYVNKVDDGYCTLCISEENFNVTQTEVFDLISSFGLDKSQTEAVLSSISMTKCTHQQYNSKLIWGPPGTGKTKTLASLLFVLLKLNYCRTLTCAPTNVAVIQVAKRLVTLFLESLAYDTYGLGDIVLVGNEKRMKIDDDFELVDIFLKYRVKLIEECILPLTGWKTSLESMISLLEDPKAKHDTYLVQVEKEDNMNEDSSSSNPVYSAHKNYGQGLGREEKRKLIPIKKKKNKMKEKKKGQASNDKADIKTDEFSTFDEFVRKSFVSLANRLVFCAENLYTHLPTSSLPLRVAKQMIELVGMLNTLVENARKNSCNFTEQVMMNREGLMGILNLLHKRFPKPKIKGSVKDFCLNNARLIFCTASGAIKIGSDVETVIIDEAAQLKECESAIPLQIFGLKTVILIGDDRQLPAMVRSKVLGKMNFGRSLFQRLAGLGKEKHLLNIQYRMHPSISLFPNKEFYQNKIVNAPNVEGRNYVKNYLKGSMFGSYSFVHVTDGKENFKKGHSPRNFKEAKVIDQIIAKLFKEHYCITKQKVSVGVLSPYKGQVGLLQEKLEKKYTKHKEKFCINIRSIDGFQGGEEDIIIISTVRSNGNGSVGFLSDRQRTNVALTRARYCLWIVGSGSTLGNSSSVWKNLIRDAKNRGCFYYADEIVNLNHETPVDKLDFFSHLKLEEARWKVTFSNEFKQSISSIKSVKAQKRVQNLLRKIADGWRQSITDDGATHELLVIYKVDKTLNLAWTVDILEEESSYIQVIKVWDVLPDSKVPDLAKNLSILFEGYSVNFINLCKYKSYEGNLVVPKSWKLHSSCEAPLTTDLVDDCLSYQFAAMNVKDNPGKPSSSVRKNCVAVWKPIQR